MKSKSSADFAPLVGLASLLASPQKRAISTCDFLRRSTIKGVIIYGAYQTLLIGLRTEAMRKKGELNRNEQIKIVTSTLLESVTDSAAMSLSIGLILLFLPWMSIPFSVLGIIGIGQSSIEIFNAFWDGLGAIRRAELLMASKEAGINLRRFLEGEELGEVFI